MSKFVVLEPYTDRKNVYPIGEPVQSESGCKAHRIVGEAIGLENAQLLARAPELAEDNRVWREVVIMLIGDWRLKPGQNVVFNKH